MSTTPTAIPTSPSVSIDAPSQTSLQAESQSETSPSKFKRKVFTLNDVKRVIEVPVVWESVYPGYEPWVFKLRLALSKDVEKKRQDWLALPEAEANDPELSRKNSLEQICDLLTDVPTGFGDLSANGAENPGTVLFNYIQKITDPDQKETVYRIVTAAYNGYWGRAFPRPSLNGSGS